MFQEHTKSFLKEIPKGKHMNDVSPNKNVNKEI